MTTSAKWYLRAVGASYYPGSTGGSTGSKSAVLPGAVSSFGSITADQTLSTQGGTATVSSVSKGQNASAVPQVGLMGRWSTAPLTAVSIAAGTWTFATCLSDSASTGQTSPKNVAGCIFVWRPATAAVVGYIVDTTTGTGSDITTSGTAGRVYTASGAAVTVVDGDILVYEQWYTVAAKANSTAHTIVSRYNNNVDVTANSSGTTTAGAYISGPTSLTDTYTYAVPTVTNVSPSSGPAGTTITLTGTDFSGTTGVTVVGVAATSVTVVSNTSLTCVVPSGSGSNQNVVVTTGLGTSAGGAGSQFSYVVNASVTAPLIGASAAGFTPSLSTAVSIGAPLISASTSFPSLVLTSGVGVTSTLISPSVALPATVESASASVSSPSISTSTQVLGTAQASSTGITTPSISASVSFIAPNLTTSSSLVVSLLNVSVSTPTPSLSASAHLTATSIISTTTLYGPVPTVTTNTNIAAGLVGVSTTLFGPTKSASASLSSPLVGIAASLLASSLSAPSNIGAPPITTSIATSSPSLRSNTTIYAEVALINSSLFMATVTKSGRLRLYWWNGAAYIPIVLKYFNGTAWVRDHRTKMFDPNLGTYRLINEPLV